MTFCLHPAAATMTKTPRSGTLLNWHSKLASHLLTSSDATRSQCIKQKPPTSTYSTNFQPLVWHELIVLGLVINLQDLGCMNGLASGSAVQVSHHSSANYMSALTECIQSSQSLNMTQEHILLIFQSLAAFEVFLIQTVVSVLTVALISSEGPVEMSGRDSPLLSGGHLASTVQSPFQTYGKPGRSTGEGILQTSKQ